MTLPTAEEMREELDRLRRDWRAYGHNVGELQEEVEQKNNRITALEAELAAANAEVEQLKERLAKAREAFSFSSTDEERRLRAERERLNAQTDVCAAAIEHERTNYRCRIAELQRELTDSKRLIYAVKIGDVSREDLP